VNAEALEAAVELIARGLRARADQIMKAEEQFDAFAWKEGGAEPGAADDAGSLVPFLVRVFRLALEDGNLALLTRLARDGDAGLGELIETGGGRLATVDRVSALTQAGLVGRDLETDRVGVTGLGQGVVELLDELGRRVEAEA
jgi:hypothetical protein